MYRKEKKNNPNWRLLKFVQQSRGVRALFIVPTNHKNTTHKHKTKFQFWKKKQISRQPLATHYTFFDEFVLISI